MQACFGVSSLIGLLSRGVRAFAARDSTRTSQRDAKSFYELSVVESKDFPLRTNRAPHGYVRSVRFQIIGAALEAAAGERARIAGK